MIVDTHKGVQISALGHYYPTSTGKADEYSAKVLKFKDGKAEAVAFFSKAMIEQLSKKGLKQQPVYLATIPSSTAKRAHNGFPQLVQNLAGVFNIQNADYNLIKRTESKEPAHKGGNRSKESAIATTVIPDDIKTKINGQYVILMDDVTTTSNSLKAGIDLLLAAKAKVLVAIALGKTTRD